MSVLNSQSETNATPEPTPLGMKEDSKPTPTPKANPCHEAEKLAALLSGEIRRNSPNFRVTPGTQRKWAICADLMLRRDGRTYEQIAAVIRWAQADEFWHSNVLSMEKVREKFDALVLKGGLHQRPRQSIAIQSPETNPPGAGLCRRCGGEKKLLQSPHVPGPRLVPCPACSSEVATPRAELDNSTFQKSEQASVST